MYFPSASLLTLKSESVAKFGTVSPKFYGSRRLWCGVPFAHVKTFVDLLPVLITSALFLGCMQVEMAAESTTALGSSPVSILVISDLVLTSSTELATLSFS